MYFRIDKNKVKEAGDGQSLKKTKDFLLFVQVKGLFKGMMYPMVSAGVLNSLFFGVYGVSLRAMTFMRGQGAQPNYLEIYLAGCAGGVAQLVVACPVDLVKIKLQTQTGQ